MLYEHTHRLIAASVAFLTLIIATVLVRRWPTGLRRAGLGVIGLGVIQTRFAACPGVAVSRAQAIGEVYAATPLLLTLGSCFGDRGSTTLIFMTGGPGICEERRSGAVRGGDRPGCPGGSFNGLERLPTALLSSTHLATSMLFASGLTYLAIRLHPTLESLTRLGKAWRGLERSVVCSANSHRRLGETCRVRLGI
ncbi:MAG: hypothetical protein R3C68_16630 [Myxococcota bacterium]